MCEFWLSSLHTYSFNTSYYVTVEVKNGALLCMRLWKVILVGRGKSWKMFREKVWEPWI